MSQQSYRIEPLDPSKIDGEQKEMHEAFYHGAEGAFQKNGEVFQWADSQTNAMIGPFPAFMALPDCSKAILQFMAALGQLPGLSAEAREIAILVSGAHYKAGYELYAHREIAKKTTELSEEQVDKISRGEKPQDLSPQLEAAYDISKRLVGIPGPLPKTLWDVGVEAFGGKEGMLALVNYCGLYAYVSILLNSVDAPVP